MDISSVLEKTEAGFTVKRVYTDPIERDGATIVLAATVRGGAGGGEG